MNNFSTFSSAVGPGLVTENLPQEGSATFSPLYQQIKALLIQSLRKGEWSPGELIPSETVLAARFQVSQGTVRKAINELVDQHLLIRKQGKGTFVSTHHEDRLRCRFLRLVCDESDFVMPEGQVIDCQCLRAPSEIADLLGLKIGVNVLKIERVLVFAGVPIVFDEIWLPELLFPGLTLDRLVAYKGPIYGFLESEFNIRMICAHEKIRAVSSGSKEAQILGIELGAPLLSVERISLTYDNRPVEVRRGLYVTDKYYYQNKLA